MRKLGFIERAYDRERGILDNAAIYAMLAQMLGDGRLSAEEYAVIQRYFFSGPNLFLPETVLEKIITASGFRLRTQKLTGRHWYRYYSFYVCTRGGD